MIYNFKQYVYRGLHLRWLTTTYSETPPPISFFLFLVLSDVYSHLSIRFVLTNYSLVSAFLYLHVSPTVYGLI